MKITARTQTVIRIAAWGAIVALFVVTDGPIALRPITSLPVNVERFLALAFVGGLFALAYPRRLPLVLVGIVAAIGLLEWMQVASFGRHARWADFSVKAVGASFGLAVSAVGQRLLRP
jgi:hypothetical protein